MKRLARWLSLAGPVISLFASIVLMVAAVLAGIHDDWTEGIYFLAFLILLDLDEARRERRTPLRQSVTITADGAAIERAIRDNQRNRGLS